MSALEQAVEIMNEKDQATEDRGSDQVDVGISGKWWSSGVGADLSLLDGRNRGVPFAISLFFLYQSYKSANFQGATGICVTPCQGFFPLTSLE